MDKNFEFNYDHIISGVDVIIKDASFGQRNYERNLYGLLGVLMKKREKPKAKTAAIVNADENAPNKDDKEK